MKNSINALSALLKGITSKSVVDYHYFNCFHSFRTAGELKSLENNSKNFNHCYKEMPKKNTLKYMKALSRKSVQI